MSDEEKTAIWDQRSSSCSGINVFMVTVYPRFQEQKRVRKMPISEVDFSGDAKKDEERKKSSRGATIHLPVKKVPRFVPGKSFEESSGKMR